MRKENVRKWHCFDVREGFNGALDLGVVDGGYDGVGFGPVVRGEGSEGLGVYQKEVCRMMEDCLSIRWCWCL